MGLPSKTTVSADVVTNALQRHNIRLSIIASFDVWGTIKDEDGSQQRRGEAQFSVCDGPSGHDKKGPII